MMLVRAVRPTLILVTMITVLFALLAAPAQARPDSKSCRGNSCSAHATKGPQADRAEAKEQREEEQATRRRHRDTAKAEQELQKAARKAEREAQKAEHEAQKAERRAARAAEKAGRKDTDEPAPPPEPSPAPDGGDGGQETGGVVSPPAPPPPASPDPSPTQDAAPSNAGGETAAGPQAASNEPVADGAGAGGLVPLPGVGGLVDDLVDAVRDVEVPGPQAVLRPFNGQPTEAVGGISLLLALLGAFLALQRGIGRGIGHVPMSTTPTWQDVDGPA